MKPKIALNQVWKNKLSSFQILITGHKGGKWKCKVLTDKAGVYGGSHEMSEYTIWRKFELL